MDSAGYGRLIEPVLAPAAAYALSITRNRHDAEDAVQQAALRGFERIDTYDAGRPFRGWWFAVLRNCCLEILRRRRSEATEPLEGRDPPDKAAPPAHRWETLAEALERLAPAHREILRLRYFGALSYRELASALDIPEGTVMSRLHFARRALMDQVSLEDL
jgi:RNA polymerase sigma-70 factor (ECF subfamily)